MPRRLLALNVHYSPQSFGGATIVAEQLNESLVQQHGWQVVVLTTHRDLSQPAYRLRRYFTRGVDVISINLPKEQVYEDEYNNPRMNRIVSNLVDRVNPDAIHAHALQHMGCGFFEHIKSRAIPLLVTLHDCWWLCDRQFMVDGNGQYCFQTSISSDRCRYCVANPAEYQAKMAFLKEKLMLADLLLAPSDFQRDLYLSNGVPGQACIVNQNGIARPGPELSRKSREGDTLNFGFVGGPGHLKGSPVIVRAFNELPGHDDYRILVVDAAQNLSMSWRDDSFWKVPGEVTFHPAYDRNSIDEFFSKIDVLLFPSQWKESFGLTVREALARDVWVIATGEGGVAEAITDGENGTLLPLTAETAPLREALLYCFENAGTLQRHQNPLRETIRYFDEQAAELDTVLCGLVDAL
jgi:glycosyltransferase involved in cell wall biosynthesis